MKLLLLMSTILLVVLSVTSAENLYPACSSAEKVATATAGQSTTVVTFNEKVSTVYLYCFAYEVQSIHDVGSPDFCAVEHQTDYPFRLTLRSTYQDDNGQTVTQDFDIRDYMGGSIDALSIYLPTVSKISIEFTNLATSSRCVMQIREIHDFMGNRAKNPSDVLSLPVLVATHPRTIATENGVRSSFILRYSSKEYVQQAAQAQLTMVGLKDNCSSQPVHTLDLNNELPAGVTVFDSTELYKSFSAIFFPHHTTTYLMCYRKDSNATATPVAAVTVYSGNPAYYEFISGIDEDGHVFDNVPLVAKFHGHDLDTRPNGDRAKLVIETDECQTGRAAGGVPEGTDLGPHDDFGPNTTYTLWSFVVRIPGAYKMCYLRANAMHWTEVPYITDAARDRTPTTTPSPDEPVPYDPETKQVCPTVPPVERKAFKTVKLTLRAAKMPGDLIPSLAKLLCIPPPSIEVAYYTTSKENRAIIYITIYCDDTNSKCDVEERYSYLHYLSENNSANLTDIGIISAKGERSVFAFGDDTRSRSPFKTFLWVVLLLALGGGGVYLFMRYKEGREHFTNFNLDDGEVDDMYDMYDLESGNLPPPAMGGSNVREDNHYVIHDAVIEMEE